MMRLPIGVPQELIHGSADDYVPSTMSSSYVEAAGAAGDPVHLTELADEGHFGYLDPKSSAWRAAADAVDRLVEK